MGSCRGHASVGRRSSPALANGARYAAISSSLNPLPARRFQRSDSSPARVSDHVSLAHLLSASASWWAIRGVMPIHSTGVPNARMTLPPLAVTAYRSSPSSSGVRAPWVNLPVSPSGVPCARVSAFIAWIVSATFACCTSSLNHRSPWCSSPCIMVSVRPHLPERLLGHNRQFRGRHVSRRPLVHPHTRCRSEEHTSELQSLAYLVCRLLLEKKKKKNKTSDSIATKNTH